MKKFISLALVLSMTALVLAGCGKKEDAKDETPKVEDTKASTDDTKASADDTKEQVEGIGELKTGLGVVTSMSSSKAATAEANGNAQVDSVIAVVTVDADGIIVKCSIDSAQTKIPFTADGKIEADLTAEVLTKTELGVNYGMLKASSIEKEWFEQAKAFADWTIGQTIDEVKSLQVKKVDDSHPMVPDVPELTSSVTISVGDFIEAIEKAVDNAKTADADVDASKIKTGLGVVTSIKSSKDASAEANGNAQVDSMMAAITLDADGKIVSCSIDSAQTKIAFTAAGELDTDISELAKTKTELGADYGMVKASSIQKEWFEQAAAFADWTIGKTVDEVSSLQVKKVDDSHPMVPDVPELTSSVTISVGDYIAAIEKAAANAQ